MSLVVPPAAVIQSVARVCPGCWPFFVNSIRNLRAPGGPAQVTSWWRSPDTNTRVGGAETSQHLVGTALDLAGPGAADLAAQLRNAGWTWIPEGDHEHLQLFPRNPFPPAVVTAGRLVV